MITPHAHRTDAELLSLRMRSDGARLPLDVLICETCSAKLAETDAFVAALLDPATWKHANRAPASGLAALRREAEDREHRVTSADEVMTRLRMLPSTDWITRIAPHEKTEELTRRLIDAAVGELDRSPNTTLAILDLAEDCTSNFDSTAAAEYRSEIWKNRANAFGVRADYKAALRATDKAARYTILWPTGRYALGQIIYTRGVILFKMGQYQNAIEAADAAITYLAEFGDRQRIAYAKSLKASASTEAGRLDESIAAYADLRPELEQLGDTFGLAMLTANTATVSLRLNKLRAARRFALEAQQRFIDLGLTAHVVRMQWVLGSISAREGEGDEAVAQLRTVADSFDALSMFGDAARAKLDIAEELLRQERWKEAAGEAREAAETFAANDSRTHLAAALAFLREAAERREATVDLVAYVRAYLEADDDAAAFEPPD